MSRLFWVGVGAVTTVAALRKAREVTDRHVPAGARSALGAAAGLTTTAQRALAELRAATAEREAELRADLLAGADLTRSRARVDAWRAERTHARADDPGEASAARRAGAAAATSAEASPASPRPGSAAAAGPRRGTGSHRAEDPDDGSLGYSFF